MGVEHWAHKEERMNTNQIAAALRRRILSGEFAYGSRLPNIRDLAAEYETSQQTAAAAYAALAGMGMVKTVRGKGGTTVTAGPPADAHLGTFTPPDLTAATAWRPATGTASGHEETTSVRQFPAPASMEAWGIPAGTEVVERTRLRTIDGTPVQHKTTVMTVDLAGRRPQGYDGVPPMLAPVGAAPADKPAGVRMAEWLGWDVAHTEAAITAEPMDGAAAAALGLQEDVPGFRIVAIAYRSSGETAFVTVTSAPLHHRVTLTIAEVE
ncbi:GntR family transcriptional regulator [Streptomyces sp. NPDC051555]|uniref:GntR family transcriptional regulator n=1 Tax=Streptomyces sp. NPDC051555 TaxID=3365657 RepID=UPI0037B05B99